MIKTDFVILPNSYNHGGIEMNIDMPFRMNVGDELLTHGLIQLARNKEHLESVFDIIPKKLVVSGVRIASSETDPKFSPDKSIKQIVFLTEKSQQMYVHPLTLGSSGIVKFIFEFDNFDFIDMMKELTTLSYLEFVVPLFHGQTFIKGQFIELKSVFNKFGCITMANSYVERISEFLFSDDSGFKVDFISWNVCNHTHQIIQEIHLESY